MEKLILFPCNATALEIIDYLRDFEIIGFVDDSIEKQGRQFSGISVYDRSLFSRFPEAKVLAVPGGPDSFLSKPGVVNSLSIDEERFITVIHSSAVISSNARIGNNVLIMAGAVVTSNAVIEDHVVVLPNSVIHHDVNVGSYTFIGSNVAIAGGVQIGKNCFVGSGSSIIQNCKIGDRVLIGLGSVVIKDIDKEKRVAGNPAKIIV